MSQETTPIAAEPAKKELKPQPISAKAGTYYRNARYIMCALLIGFGAWCVKDGFISWPERNRQIDAVEAEMTAVAEDNSLTSAQKDEKVTALDREKVALGDRKGDLSILINQILAIVLPPLGLLYLGWTLYNSRGRVALENDTIHMPGHPPIPLKSITKVDSSKWDRKGIAELDYKLDDGTEGHFKLDDFVYDREPIDAIYDHVLEARATAVNA